MSEVLSYHSFFPIYMVAERIYDLNDIFKNIENSRWKNVDQIYNNHKKYV